MGWSVYASPGIAKMVVMLSDRQVLLWSKPCWDLCCLAIARAIEVVGYGLSDLPCDH